jgi:N-acetylmuramoyl-L-alanine amidase
METVKNPNPNYKERSKIVHGIIIHSMGEQIGGQDAAAFLESVGLSAHYLVKPDGTVIETVDPSKRAYHAGESEHLGETDLNSSYIGIEVLVRGDHTYSSFKEAIKKPDTFTEAQYEACEKLCKYLKARFTRINEQQFVTHSQVSGDHVRGAGKGKIDPGSGFDFERLKKQVFS